MLHRFQVMNDDFMPLQGIYTAIRFKLSDISSVYVILTIKKRK